MAGLVLIDWGTSAVRAWRVDDDGDVIGRRRLPRGVGSLRPDQFRPVFDGLTADWRDGRRTPTLLAGMVGSRQGWVETAYVQCPAGLDDLAAALRPVPGLEAAWIVPGVACRTAAGAPEVMRGEEVQALGAVPPGARGRATLCLPGTHSKWVRIGAGGLAGFATAMTGELFAVLRRHSLLAATTTEPSRLDPAEPAFLDGVGRAAEAGGLPHHLFAVRTRALLDGLAPAAATAYLSGLLLGHEIAGMRRLLAPSPRKVLVVGEPALAALYAAAMRRLGIAARQQDGEQASIRGLAMLARHAQLA